MTVLIQHFQLGMETARQLALFEPRYNIAPTQEILAVRVEPKSGTREAAMLRWGLVPAWSKEPTGGAPMINARGESIAEKPSFRTAVRSRRCLIPADGFYEWQKSAGSTGRKGSVKQPYYIHYRDDRLRLRGCGRRGRPRRRRSTMRMQVSGSRSKVARL